jgi:DNA-binding HxlR family transcriptional regulator
MANLQRTYGCPVELSLDLLGGKWKSVILARLKQRPLRYGELRRDIPALSDKVLSERLRSLSELGLIETATDDAGTVRYRLTSCGESLRPVLQALYDWGDARAAELGVTIRASEDV